MPTYDYRCDACGNEFSGSQKFGEEPVAECPRCGARPRRLLSLPAIVFKGSGWHVTDYRRGRSGESGDGKPAEDAAQREGAKAPPKDEKQTKDEKRTKKEDAPAPPDPAANS